MPTTPAHPGTATIATTRDGRIEITFPRARLFGVRGCACDATTCADGVACWPDDWTVTQTPGQVLASHPDSDLGDLDTLLTQAEQATAAEMATEVEAETRADRGTRHDGSIDHGARARMRRAAMEHA